MVAAIGLPIKQSTAKTPDVGDDRPRTKFFGKSIGSPKKWDVFISHATEDKDDFVRPLAGSAAGQRELRFGLMNSR